MMGEKERRMGEGWGGGGDAGDESDGVMLKDGHNDYNKVDDGKDSEVEDGLMEMTII